MRNLTFVLIPFSVTPHFTGLVAERLEQRSDWHEEQLDLRYFYRFISNKVDGSQGENRCRHYLFHPKRVPALRVSWKCAARVKKPVGEYPFGTFSVTPAEPELFLFSTGVCILAFPMALEAPDLPTLVNARYNLKKVSITRYFAPCVEESFTLMDIARQCVAGISAVFDTDFFFYTNHHSELGYLLTMYFDAQPPDDRMFVHLQYAVSLNQQLSPQLTALHGGRLSVTERITWGLTDQSAFCCCAECADDHFINDVFPRNFGKEYKYLFVFLLHQKYTLYSFLTRIDTELQHNLDRLEAYKRDFSDFKTYFVFSQVSEIVQYRLLYEAAYKAFELDEMYEDVTEPLDMLDEVMRREEEKRRSLEDKRREQTAKAQERRENRLNWLLALLSVLGIVSAFADAAVLASGIGATASAVANGSIAGFLLQHIPHLLVMLPVLGWSVFILVKLLSGRKGRLITQHYHYIGVFFPQEALSGALSRIDRHPLARQIEQLHVTVAYRPEQTPTHLFGEHVRVIVKGYGCDGVNEGLLVELHSDDPELSRLLSARETPHITLSVSGNGQPKDTARLAFRPVPVSEFTGVFGGMTEKREVILQTDRQ